MNPLRPETSTNTDWSMFYAFIHMLVKFHDNHKDQLKANNIRVFILMIFSHLHSVGRGGSADIMLDNATDVSYVTVLG